MPIVPAGGSGVTVGSVVNRVLNEYVHPISEAPIIALLAAGCDNVVTTLTLSLDLLAVDERDAFAPATVVEIGTEQILIRTITIAGTDATCTVVRGWQGTNAAIHALNDAVAISPDVTRLSVFNAIGDEVVSLWPTLWAIGQNTLTVTGLYAEVDQNALEVEHVRWLDSSGRPHELDARLIHNFPESSTTKALRFNEVPSTTSSAVLTYRAALSRPTVEGTTLSALGIQEDWQSAIILGAAARVVLALDPRKLQPEYISEAIEGEQVPAGTPSAIAQRLRRAADIEKDMAGRRWRETHPTTVSVSNPLRPWG